MESFSLKRHGIFVLTSGFLVGVGLASIGLVWAAFAVFLFFLSIVLILYTFVFIKEKHIRGSFSLIIVFLLFISLGIFRFMSAKLPYDSSLASAVNSKTEVAGVVVVEPKIGSSYRQYVLKTERGVKVLVRANPYPAYKFGDQLSSYGKLELPKSFVTEQGTTFDYPAYLSKEGISYVMSFTTVRKTGEGRFPVQKFLFGIKNKFVASLERVIPYPESGLLAGILLGVTDGMGKDLLNIFRMVGIIHIVVLSGYNITIVAESIRKSLSFVSLRNGLIAGAIGIFVFSTMVGWTPSVARASIMAVLAIVARATRRKYEVGRALALAAFGMVLWNPKVLVFDLGFQLSFLATIALIWLSQYVIKKLIWIPERFGFREIVGTTITVQLFVLPLLAYTSGIVSLGGFVVNFLVLPFIPVIMLLGLITATLGLVSSALAFVPGAITHFFLFYIIWISETFSKLPGSVISISNIPSFVPVIIYVIFGISYMYFKRKKHPVTERSFSKIN